MVQRRVLQCGLCRNEEKCLKPGLKCVNIWSISTVQRKRVPESWSSNRETTSSSVAKVTTTKFSLLRNTALAFDGRTEFRQQDRVLHYMQPQGKDTETS